MKLQAADPGHASNPRTELPLSRTDLLDLMQAVIEKDRLFRFQAKGWSMSPFIKDGDVTVLSPLTDADPRLGDVVAALHPETRSLALHRVIGRKAHRFLIRGDNNPTSDGFVESKNILARVIRVERNGERVVLGSGPERFVIALLSRIGVLGSFLNVARRIRERITG